MFFQVGHSLITGLTTTYQMYPLYKKCISFLNVTNSAWTRGLSMWDFQHQKDKIILATHRGHFGRFLGFSDFSKDENKSCLNDIKFWEVSRNPKTSKFWKLKLSILCGTQKSAKITLPVTKMIWSFTCTNLKMICNQ